MNCFYFLFYKEEFCDANRMLFPMRRTANKKSDRNVMCIQVSRVHIGDKHAASQH